MVKSRKKNNNGAVLGFEETLWRAADKLRGHMDAAEYKHVVLGLIFLKYISDAFQEHYNKLKALATIRDALLPKLLSGEGHVNDLKTLVEKVQ